MRYPLPYAFARTFQLLLEDDGQHSTLVCSANSDEAACTEVMRRHAVHALQRLESQALAQRISAAYAQGESSAASVVSEVESDADLSRIMQE